MTEEELEEAMLDPYEEDPEAAEEDALEDELAWKMNLLMTDLVGEMWGRATVYVVPEGSESSWARTLLSISALGDAPALPWCHYSLPGEEKPRSRGVDCVVFELYPVVWAGSYYRRNCLRVIGLASAPVPTAVLPL
jgi:hypothetical protein